MSEGTVQARESSRPEVGATTARPEQRLRLRDGSSLAFEDRGSGPPLLLIHGFTGSRRAWPEAVLREVAREHRLLIPDVIGHGASERTADPRRYALERVVDDLCQLLDACAVERATWIGYSMGGRIALGAAVERPAHVAGLVLEGSSPGLADPDERAARRSSDAELARSIEKDGIDRFVERWMDQPLFATQRVLSSAVRRQQRALRLENDASSLGACLMGLGSGVQPCFWDRLADVRTPTLLIAGALDAKFLAIAERMRRGLCDARVAPIADAGHTTHLEQPERYLAALLPFLEQL